MYGVFVSLAVAVSFSGPLYAQGVTTAPSNLNATVVDGGVALSWDAPTTDVGTVTGYEVLRRRGAFGLLTYVDDTGTTATSYTDTGAAERSQTYVYQVKALRGSAVSDGSNEVTVTIPGMCPISGSDPVEVTVSEVPIVVTSTTADYFVLYVLREVDGETLEVPVSVALGAAGTTTLTDNLEALPADRYKVEKYQVADPADVDGDCVDDITELEDLGSKDPVNRAPGIDITNGTVAIPDRETFERLSYRGDQILNDRHLTGLEFVKFWLLHVSSDNPAVYFMNTVTHRSHPNFARTIPFSPLDTMRGEIIYHPNVVAPDGSLGVYRYEFEPWDDYAFEDVALSYELLAASMPLLENNLAYYPMPRYALPLYHQEKALYDASRVNVLLEEDIFPDVDFISLNRGDGYGYLREMSLEERPNPRDIVIYEALPNDLPRVAGIITAVPQTPLSHVNLRAVQNRVPNAFIRNVLDNNDIESLIGSHVYYKVTESEYTIRAATKAEVDAFYDASRPALAQTPERDLTVTDITALSDIGFDDWDAFGVKAANVAVLGTLGFPSGTVPNGFAVPFYFYDEFMKANDLYTDVATMLADTDFQTDFGEQEKDLKKLRKKIKDGTTPAWIITALEEMHATYPEGQSLRYRSSTNNEDLPGFSGAGLYDSKTQDPDETEEDGIDKSIKGVWASLWNFGAFVERDFHRIDHTATAMGVLVHPNYSDESANGVAVSFDPVTGREGVYYANTQLGEDLVTNPDANSTPEEILLLADGSYEVLVYSSHKEQGELLMKVAQMEQLREHLEVIHDDFKALYDPAEGERFAMDIEFKITSADILAIKQARPWVFPPVSQPPAFPSTETGRRTVPENTGMGIGIGDPVAATDANGDTLTYHLGGPDGRSFSIVQISGKLLTRAALDYESKDRYTVEVSVRDGKDPTGAVDTAVDATITVTITVTDEEEAGTVKLSSDDPRVDLPLNADVEDPDGGVSVNTWRWERSLNGRSGWDAITGETSATYTPVDGDIDNYLRATATYADRMGTGKSAERVSANRVQGSGAPPPPPPSSTSDTGGSSGGGGGGSSGSRPQDQHGNSPRQATRVQQGSAAPWASSTSGQLSPASDADYFQLMIPQAGVLVVETTGSTDTVGTVWQEDEALAMAASGGDRQNFRLSVPVQAGAVVVAVEGNGRQTGSYTLQTRLVVGFLENPGRASFQSGIGVISGWVCAADLVEITIDDLVPLEAAYGTERADTTDICGDTDNGFGLLYNWNHLGDGEHTVVALVDGIELGQATVTVTTLDAEDDFVEGLAGECRVEHFPMAGETVTLTWQQTSQNFVMAGETAPAGKNAPQSGDLVGYLENPGPNSFQSGIGVISGWVCAAEVVEIVIGDAAPQVAGYGTERLDTEAACGDTANGFGLLYNWNHVGEGVHTVVAHVDGVALGYATVHVTPLDAEDDFVEGLAGACTVENFPMAGETVTLEWQQNSQNFVIVSHDPDGMEP